MNLRLSALDEEIYLAEQLITLNHQALDNALEQSLQRTRDRARATLTSPIVIVGAAALVGYWLFKRRGRGHQSPEGVTAKKSLLGMLAAAGFSLAQAHFGGPIGMAQWAAGKLSRRQAPPPVEF